MKTEIIKPTHPALKNIVQYFIVFNSETTVSIDYSTFPNTNVCLAIYKQNKIIIEQSNENKHLFTYQGEQTYVSYLSGFHESNFNVSVNSPIDELCVVFYPAALRLFSNISYHELVNSDCVFELLFPNYAHYFLEQLFDEDSSHKRIVMLENVFLKSITQDYLTNRAKEVLQLINASTDLKVSSVAKSLSLNESTLYRLFMNQIGQNPKSFLKTVRFRQALNDVLHSGRPKLTGIAYRNHYSDQSHFIRDFKEITGQTPNQLKNKTSVQQEELAWIYAQH